jgi:hypothetical protein
MIRENYDNLEIEKNGVSSSEILGKIKQRLVRVPIAIDKLIKNMKKHQKILTGLRKHCQKYWDICGVPLVQNIIAKMRTT